MCMWICRSKCMCWELRRRREMGYGLYVWTREEKCETFAESHGKCHPEFSEELVKLSIIIIHNNIIISPYRCGNDMMAAVVSVWLLYESHKPIETHCQFPRFHVSIFVAVAFPSIWTLKPNWKFGIRKI